MGPQGDRAFSVQWATGALVCNFTDLFICADRFLSFSMAAFLYWVEKLRNTVDIALLFILKGVKRVVTHLYTDRKGNFVVSAHLRSKWAVCEMYCTRSAAMTSLSHCCCGYVDVCMIIKQGKNTKHKQGCQVSGFPLRWAFKVFSQVNCFVHWLWKSIWH